jgi:protein-tyrosine phosphatase
MSSRRHVPAAAGQARRVDASTRRPAEDREIVSLLNALSSYRRFFETVAQDAHRPVLFHCTTGRDRTGWAAASTLLFLGVSKEDVLHDYLLTDRDLPPALQPAYERFRAAGGDRHLLDPVLGVERACLEAALDEMHARFGSCKGYIADGLHIDAEGTGVMESPGRLASGVVDGGAGAVRLRHTHGARRPVRLPWGALW